MILAPTTAASTLERQVTASARELREMPAERVAELSYGELPRLPSIQATAATGTAAAAVEIEPVSNASSSCCERESG